MSRKRSGLLWAQILARIYEVLPLLCPACGGEMRVLAPNDRGQWKWRENGEVTEVSPESPHRTRTSEATHLPHFRSKANSAKNALGKLWRTI